MDKKFFPQFNKSLSRLGYGTMRFPMQGKNVDRKATQRLLDIAYDAGINYYDTAYIYHGGISENILGDYLCKVRPRDSFYLADKMPSWELAQIQSSADMERVFHDQLHKLSTDLINFYLIHSLRGELWEKMKEKGVFDFLDFLRKTDKVEHVGFSFHGTPEELARIVSEYDWDFAQLQINYFDWSNQRAQESHGILQKNNIPNVVMEPVRGGNLAILPENISHPFRELPGSPTNASLALRWVGSLENIMITLSGMSNEQQLKENIDVFSDFKPLTEKEYTAISQVVESIRAQKLTPCTGCRYCATECPVELDIPGAIDAANTYRQFENESVIINYVRETAKEKIPALCLQCGKCARVCPQKIDIPQEMSFLKGIMDQLS